MSRLDTEIVNRGLSTSRETAKKLILSSVVFVDGELVTKPSYDVSDSNAIRIADNIITKYVSRGALKLEKALDHFDIDVKGLIAVDFGASTGGFTDVLLQRGAKKVFAIENGYGQLHEKLANDSRVVSLENTNARYIDEGFIPKCDIAVMDVSFISQIKLYNSVVNVLKNEGIFISLIKPQFEAGKKALNKKGIVKDNSTIKSVIEEIKNTALNYKFETLGVIESPILGGDGNREFLVCFKHNKELDS